MYSSPIGLIVVLYLNVLYVPFEMCIADNAALSLMIVVDMCPWILCFASTKASKNFVLNSISLTTHDMFSFL